MWDKEVSEAHIWLQWNGMETKNNSKPLLSWEKEYVLIQWNSKPAKFMEDMTYDMAGSAVVAGLMKNFALRKAKINAVSVVGLLKTCLVEMLKDPGILNHIAERQ